MFKTENKGNTEYLYARAVLVKMYLSGVISRKIFEIAEGKLHLKFGK